MAPEGAVVRRPHSVPDVRPVDPPVGACLMRSWMRWREIDADFWTIRTLKRGFRWEFKSLPPLSPLPIPFYIDNLEKKELVRDHIRKMYLKGAIEPVCGVDIHSFYSRIFLTPKKICLLGSNQGTVGFISRFTGLLLPCAYKTFDEEISTFPL